MALGIPYHALPVNDNNELLLENHFRWLHAQDEKESHVAVQQPQPMLIEDEDWH